MAVTRDLDMSMSSFLQFVFKYGCDDRDHDWPIEHMVLVQYSINGGISWKLLDEIHYDSGGSSK